MEVECLSEMLQGAFGGLCVDVVGGISAEKKIIANFIYSHFRSIF